MNGNIYLHPKHGLNPTMPVCILCNEPTGEIALLGNKYNDQAPMHMVIGIEPCEACRKKYLSKGVMLVEAEGCYHGGMDEKKRMVPNGNVSVIKTSAYKRMFPEHEIPKGRIVYCEPGLLGKINALTQYDKTKNV